MSRCKSFQTSRTHPTHVHCKVGTVFFNRTSAISTHMLESTKRLLLSSDHCCMCNGWSIWVLWALRICATNSDRKDVGNQPCTILHPQPHFFPQCTQSTCALHLCPWHSSQMHQRSRLAQGVIENMTAHNSYHSFPSKDVRDQKLPSFLLLHVI